MKRIALILSLLISTSFADDDISLNPFKNNPLPKETDLPPELEVLPVELPNNYCFGQYLAKPVRCCQNLDTEVISFDMDGRYGRENGKVCAIKGFHGVWNDRSKYVATKDQWEDFKEKWDNEYKINYNGVSVFVGEDESMLNFAWYGNGIDTPKVRISTDSKMSNAIEFTGKIEKSFTRHLNNVKYKPNKVTVTGLERHKTYYYQVYLDGVWKDTVQFNTYDPDNFKVAFIGDPQIGGSYDRLTFESNLKKRLTKEEATRNDAFNWNMTINKIFEKTEQPSLILSAGDQIDYEYQGERQEGQYAAFFLPEKLKTIPIAEAVGNHEAREKTFNMHYNVPNPYETPVEPKIAPGYSYFFKYNNILVVVLETNFGYCEDYQEVMRRAYNKYPNTDWRIALFHHDIYSSGWCHHGDKDISDFLRPCLTELFTKYKFDLAINGHDHVYSTSHFVTFNDQKSKQLDEKYDLKKLEKGKTNEGNKGTFFITANCSTGSKLYGYNDYIDDYLAFYNQTFTSSFGTIDFEKKNGKVKMTINTFEVDTLRQIDGPFIFEKPEKNWAEKLGYPSCKENKQSVYEDQDGKWGVENDNWCGIVEEDIPFNTKPIESNYTIPDSCWAYSLGYQCCLGEDIEVTYVDESGNWSMQNGRWCGIVEKDDDVCWTQEKYNLDCCSDQAIHHLYLNEGELGIEPDGRKCGFSSKKNRLLVSSSV